MAYGNENNNSTIDNEQLDTLLPINPYIEQNFIDQKIKYIELINSVEMRNTRLCHLFKVFFDKPQYIDYNSSLLIETFRIIYEDPYITSTDIELYYIKNKCYHKIYEYKVILNEIQIRNIILIILFMYGMRNNILFTISIWFLYYLLF